MNYITFVLSWYGCEFCRNLASFSKHFLKKREKNALNIHLNNLFIVFYFVPGKKQIREFHTYFDVSKSKYIYNLITEIHGNNCNNHV
jgi:hypothetical protein